MRRRRPRPMGLGRYVAKHPARVGVGAVVLAVLGAVATVLLRGARATTSTTTDGVPHEHACSCGNRWRHGVEADGSRAEHTCSACGRVVAQKVEGGQ